MTSKSAHNRYAYLVWVVVVALALSLSSTVLPAQDDEEELSLEELQEQRELVAEEIAAAAASIDATTATIEEIATAMDDVAALANIHQIRLEEATERYQAALDRLNQAEESHAEVIAEIDILRGLVSDLALAQFTGESGNEPFELAMSTDPGQSSRLAHLLELQTGNAEDAVDRLRVLERQAEELVAESNAASSLAEESLTEMEHRSGELEAAIGQQEQLLDSAQQRLAASEADAEAAEILLEETEERLLNYVRGIGAPAPVDRADIVTISFYEGSATSPRFQIQVHKDIEEQTRGLYQLAFSQGIDLGGWGFRTTGRQIELRRAHCGATDYDVWLKPASQCSPPTARPGYSKHEQGRAIDFQWNGGSIGARSGTPFRWLAAHAPQFGFVNLPSEPWHWSDGTATTFDPTVPVPDLADAAPEVEPDETTAELLSEPLDEDGEVVVGEEVAIELGGETEEISTDEALPAEALASVDDEAAAGATTADEAPDEATAEPASDDEPEPPVDEEAVAQQPEVDEASAAEAEEPTE